ncbi:MAG: MoaD/ThiS family protein [Deltaproteobacteria bacterium]|nr:MoaD/ThiS family protein [Deltaproteobacteria bacterium]MBW2050147.1 MoaD/ThiS family protein [Deltaproteobacteria bacterium]MBW2354869.1 MoaD/ThiS family protein [Deltaproteobacteria bacterium]
MKLKVKLFGTLGKRFPGYHHERGMDVEIPDGARVRDLLAHLNISKSFGGVVAVEGKLLAENAILGNGAEVNIFQSVFGG